MTTITITTADGTTITVEPAAPARTVYTVDVRSPQAVLQRIEEAQRRQSRAPRTTIPDGAVLHFIDQLVGDDLHGQVRAESKMNAAGDGPDRDDPVEPGRSCCEVAGVRLGVEVPRDAVGRSGRVDPDLSHDSSPSSGCGDTTVGDEAGPGSRIGEPVPRQAHVDALRDLLALMEGYSCNDQRARFLLSSDFLRDNGGDIAERIGSRGAR